MKKWESKKWLIGITCFAVFILAITFLKKGDLNKNMSQNGEYNKVLILGIDGMDPKITQALIDQGKLPHFQKLKESGYYSELQTVFPPQSPVAWTTIATGMNAGKHNIFDFIRRDPKTYTPVLGLFDSANSLGSGTRYTSLITADSFWKRLGDEHDIESNIVRWPVTFPAEKMNGKLLSGLGVPDVKGFLGGYTFYTDGDFESGKDSSKVEKVDISSGSVDTIVFGPRTMSGGDIIDVTAPVRIEKVDGNVIKIFNGGQEQEIAVGEWTEWFQTSFSVNFFTKASGMWRAYLQSMEPFELFVTTMQVDPSNPSVPISYPERYASDLANEVGLFYTLGLTEETDGLIDGALSDEGFLGHVDQIESERDDIFWNEFEKFQERDRGVFAFVYDSSDRLQHTHWDDKKLTNVSEETIFAESVEEYYMHKDDFLGELLDNIDNDTAVLILSDHGFTSFERGFNVNTWLYKNGYMSLDADVTEEDDGSLFSHVEWDKTRAYSIGFNAIYVNKKGREGQGIVENEDEILDEIIAKLEGYVDEETGKKVVYKAYKAKDIWHGEAMDDAPDIVLGYYPGYRTDWKTAIGGFTIDVVTNNEKVWNGDHMVDPHFVPGVLFTNFSLKNSDEKIEQVDIVPTIYQILNIIPPDDLDGKGFFL